MDGSLTEKIIKDATPKQPSERVSVKELAEKFTGLWMDRSDQTGIKQKAKVPLINKRLKTERNSMVDGIGSGTNIFRITGTIKRPVSYYTPTQIKLTDKSIKDATLEQPSERVSVKELAEKFTGLVKDSGGQTDLKQKVTPPLKDIRLTTETNSIRNGKSSDSIRHCTTETLTRPVSDYTRTESKAQGYWVHDPCLETNYEAEHGSDSTDVCMEKEQGILEDDSYLETNYEVEHYSDVTEKHSDVRRPEIGLIYQMNDKDIRRVLESLNMDVTAPIEDDKQKHCFILQKNSDFVRPEAKVIDGMDYIQIAELLRSLNINSLGSFQSDIKQLKKSLFSGQMVDSTSKKIKDVLNKTVERYKGLKSKLLKLYSSVITTVRNKSLKTNMGEVIEMRFPHYEEELQRIKTVLQNMTEEFEIVVSGQTSSGKSTFLNVLLGERILPAQHLHTTANICRLRNSENRRIECFVGERIVDKTTLTTDSSQLRKKLDSITKKLLSQDGDREPLKCIDIYWPVSSLHDNVVLVDTPGIGERDALTRHVEEFVPNAAGYIFIVNSANAGGIQDSGIRKLIQAIAVSAPKEDFVTGLGNMIFVCNKWDLVPIGERENVMEDTKRKIRQCCGQLGDWQIITFNGDLELKLLELNANPTDDFRTLLKSLKKLMISTIKARLRDKYRWICTFVSELEGLIKVGMNVVELSKENVQNSMKRARSEIDLATKELEKCSEVETLICKEEKSLIKHLEDYLKSEHVQRQHFDWTICSPKQGKVEEDGPALIFARLQDAIFEWATSETGPFKEASVRITDICKEMQFEIDSRISNLNHLDLGFSLMKSSDQSDFWSDVYLPENGFVMIGATSPISIVLGLAAFVIGIIPGIVWAISRAATAKKRSIKRMTELTKDIIDKFIMENHLQNYINSCFTGRYIKWLTKFKNDTVCTITSTRAWILRMETDLYLNSEQQQMFQSLQTKLTHYSNFLHKFKNGI